MKKLLLLLVLLPLTVSASILNIREGGTGTSTKPSLGQILIGRADGFYDYVASSTFGGGSLTSWIKTGDSLAHYPNPVTLVTLIGTTATSSLDNVLEVGSKSQFNTELSGYVKLKSQGSHDHSFLQSAYSNALFNSNGYFNGSAWVYDRDGFFTGYQGAGITGDIRFNTGPSGTAGDIFTPTTRMIILNEGNVGIGTLTPGAKLTVNGTASTTALTISGIKSCSSTSALVTDVNGVVSCGAISGSGGGGAEVQPFTAQAYGMSTSTVIGFLNGLFSTASTTINSTFKLPTLATGGLWVDPAGLVSSGATTTAGTGLTYSGNAFNVNTSQVIATLSNLTDNGFVKTSGGGGTLSVDTTTYESGLTAGDGLTRTANDFDCDVASGSVDGCLDNADWTTFNNKQATLSTTFPITLSGATLGFGGLSTSSPLSAGASVLYATGVNTIASVATGTISVPTGLTVTANRYALGGNAVIGLDTGYVIPLLSALGSPYPFTPTTNYGAATNATTGIVWFQNGLQASSTSKFVYASTTALTVSGNTYFPNSSLWNSAGAVGIGTTSIASGASLHIDGTNAGTYVKQVISNNSPTGIETLRFEEQGLGRLELWYDNSANASYLKTIEAGSSLNLHNENNIGLTLSRLGYLGIGSTSPNASLTVVGTTTQTHPLVHVYKVGAGYATSTAFTIASAGNVGIGTTTPYAPLSVVGEAVATNFTATSTTATSTFFGNVTIANNNRVMAGNNSLSVGQADSSGGANYYVVASGIGSLAHGRSLSVAGGPGASIVASGNGSFAGGHVQSIVGQPQNSIIRASGIGAIAHGYSADKLIEASGQGALAIGNASSYGIVASGNGSFAAATTGIGTTTATAAGAWAIGDGISNSGGGAFAFGSTFTNTTASTFKVGFTAEPTLTINSTSVGIGTTSPNSKLTVVGTAIQTNDIMQMTRTNVNYATSTILSLDNAGNLNAISRNLVQNGTFSQDTDWTKSGGFTITAGFSICSNSDGTISQNIGELAAHKYRVTYTWTTSDAITTMTPSIGGTNGTGRVSSGTYTDDITAINTSDLTFTCSGVDIGGQVDNVTVYDLTENRLVVNTGASVVVVNGAGQLGAGTTTPQYALTSFSATLPQLALSSGAGYTQWTMRNSYGTLYFSTTTTNGLATTTRPAIEMRNTGQIYAPFTTTSGSAQTGYWCYDTSGQLIRDTTVCIVSALKFKTDIKPLDVGLKDLLAIKPVSYFYKDKAFGTKRQMGVIADWVAKNPKLNEMLVTYDSDGAVHGFNYDTYTALLTKSVQEFYGQFQKLVARVSGLEQRVNEQDKKIKLLETRLKVLEKKI